jgi:hypothetical protein
VQAAKRFYARLQDQTKNDSSPTTLHLHHILGRPTLNFVANLVKLKLIHINVYEITIPKNTNVKMGFSTPTKLLII